jgi:hypothetical protein
MIAFKKASRVAREAPYKNKKIIIYLYLYLYLNNQSCLNQEINLFIKKINKKTLRTQSNKKTKNT